MIARGRDSARWIGPYRCTGRSRIDDPNLVERLTSDRRVLRRAHAVSRFAAIAVMLSIGTWFAFRPGESGPMLAAVTAVGAIILALGPVGGLLEIIFAQGRGSRILFGVATALAVTGFPLEGDTPGRDPGFWACSRSSASCW